MQAKANNTLSGSHAACDSMCNAHHITSQHAQLVFFGQAKDFFSKLFNTGDWPPRWHCGTWSDFHGWLYILSDTSIWAAYFAIPFLLFRIINKRKDIPFPKIIWLFIAFILLCGTTHLIDAGIFWWPAYRISALVRFITAIVSVFTLFALYKILPMIYNLRTLDQLEAEIGERKRVETEMRHHQVMQQAAEELIIKKDEFMSIASHELKTPITSLKASLQVVERMAYKNEILEPVVPFVQKASKQVNKLTEIIHDLLDVTRMQAGKLELMKTDFNLTDIINECVDQCPIEVRRHEIQIGADPVLMVHADKNRIEQVINNFLTNAIKYSPESELISINAEKFVNGTVKVYVTDYGIGIPDDKLENIFDRFYRVENTSKNYSGIGLGLYISSEIIKRHHGQIGVNSVLGEGSTFWFII